MALKQFRSRHALGLGLLCAGCSLAVVLLYGMLAAYQRLEARVSDNLQIKGRKGELPPNVIFLPIDSMTVSPSDLMEDERRANRALELISKGWPFSRALYPEIIKRLVDAGANVVAFDMLFPSEREGDDEFAAALEKYGNRVVIGSNLERDPKPALIPPSASLMPSTDGSDPRVGYVNFEPEADGKVRSARFRTTTLESAELAPEQRAELWSLAAQAVRKAGFEDRVPTDHLTHRFRFVRDTHPLFAGALSLHDIFVDGLWKAPPYDHGALFRDKIVLIGPSGNWSKDELPTPFGQTLGPEIQLSAMSALLHRDFLTETPVWVDLLLIVGAGLLAWVASVRIPDPLVRSGAFLAAVALYIAVAFLLYNTAGLCLLLLSPNLALLSSGGLGLVWERVVERREKLRVRRTLERYVSRDVVKEVLDNPESYLHTIDGVSRKPIAVLFSDIRGFTAMTETADATLLVKQLNEYFTEMVRIVFAHLGTLDKFIGDAVMAHWGAVMSRGEGPDACRAVMAALDMQRALRKLNAGWKARGMMELRIGLGVSQGLAICGHLGSNEKQEFSAIGDTVNLASRLESATKTLKVDLLIGHATAELVRESMTLRSVALLQVSGRARAEKTYTVLDLREAPGTPPWLAPYEEGVRLYREREFAEAERSLAVAGELNPEDGLIADYLRQTRAFLTAPPPEDWEGVHVLTKK